ncbi:MAG TPA: UDP-N-acetylmuramoyl-tripeptide--D-alanyl-D-alanine ligase [Terriglobales bacterium]|nr:UDP-N-acetylmuramoyl-tripeptide--D-alanyl-D-alanine ligase [Terriglobales bacterium]
MKLPLGRIAEIISGFGRFREGVVAHGYSIDSRTLQPGELFFAVKGDRLDGHDFVSQALEKGAAAAVIRADRRAYFPPRARLIAVEDTLAALQNLAAAVRRIWGKPVVGITGSAGKTTTKEAIAHLLATRFRVHKSEGNLNNHFGLPLMLLRLEPEHEVAVIEMGMSHLGEIRELARIAQPEIGVVTCVAPVHLEFFSSVAEIARAKYELVESLPAGGTAVLNADDEYVSQFGRDFAGKVVTFGVHHPASVRAERIEMRGAQGSAFEIVAGSIREPATLPLVGGHNIPNALAAAAVALEQGIPLVEAAGALSDLAPADKRGQVIEVGGATVINDCYNSNPKALDAMVDALLALPARRRIVVAGEMLELGPTGPELHRESGRRMAERGVNVLVGVRGQAEQMVEGARQAGLRAAEFIVAPEDAGEWLAREAHAGDAVLLKASRGVRLEKALERWRERVGAAEAGHKKVVAPGC